MILQYFPVADEDELTFDPGEVINNIEFVSMIGLHTKLFNICRIPRTVVMHMFANIYTRAQILACDMIFCVSEFLYIFSDSVVLHLIKLAASVILVPISN